MTKLLKNDTLFTYKQVRCFREELQKIKTNHHRALTADDFVKIKKIEALLAELKERMPHLCSKDSYIQQLRAESTPTFNTSATRSIRNISDLKNEIDIDMIEEKEQHDSVVPMELDETLMQYNQEKSQPSVSVITVVQEENQQPVASTTASQKLNISTLTDIQKLYIQALELWKCVDQLETHKKK